MTGGTFESATERIARITRDNAREGRPWWVGLRIADITPDEWRRLPDAAKDELEATTLQANARKATR